MGTTGIEFDFSLAGTGWAKGRLAIGDQATEITASYLNDALGELLKAVLAFAEGADETRASWIEEPGEYRWIFRRTPLGVRVSVLEFPHMPGFGVDTPDDKGQVLLDAECPDFEFVEAIATGARHVFQEHGSEGYQAKWVRHPFPEDDLASLDRWLTKQ